MKKIVILALAVWVAACASTGGYREATSKYGSGYRDKAISNDQWLITYRSNSAVMGESYRYALRRAAEVSRQQGYDWFEVVSRETISSKDDERSGVSAAVGTRSGCGYMGCSGSSVGLGVGFSSGPDREDFTTQIEIRMGKGVRPDKVNVYSVPGLLSAADDSKAKEN